MTQLALLLALSLFGVVLSLGLGRLEVKRGNVSLTLKRAEGALERASVALLRLGGTRALTLMGVPALGLGACLLWGPRSWTIPLAGRVAFVVGALVAGAASTLLHARLTLGLGTRAVSGSAAAAARGSARAMRPLLRAAAAIAVFGEGCGALGLAGTFAALYAVRGGFAASSSHELAAEVARLTPAFALGAAIAALALARDGAIAAGAASLGGARRAPLSEGTATDNADARAPGLLAELAGQLTGELLPRALSGYVGGVTATVATLLLALHAGPAGPGALTWLVLAILMRAFGAVASVCGVFAARVTDDEPPLLALWRAQASALLVAIFGLAAASFWVTRADLGPVLVAGLAGALSLSLVSVLAWLPLRRGVAANREAQETRVGGEGVAIARGTSAGLLALWPALVVPALVLSLLDRLDAPPPLLLTAFAAGALALQPLALALNSFGVLANHARGVAALARLELEPRRRVLRFEEASVFARVAGSTHQTLVLPLSLLLGLTAFSPAASAVGSGALGLVVGIVLVLGFGARATRSAVGGARGVALEVERQLGDARGAAPPTTAPSDFTPNYKGCVDAALDAARATSPFELAVLLVVPFGLTGLLAWRSDASPIAPMAVLAAAAVWTGLALALAGRATRVALAETGRARGADAGSATRANEIESFGELVGVTAAGSVEALAFVLALTVFCLAALLR